MRLSDLKDDVSARESLASSFLLQLQSLSSGLCNDFSLTMPHQKPAQLLLNASVCLRLNRSTMPASWVARDIDLHLPQPTDTASWLRSPQVSNTVGYL